MQEAVKLAGRRCLVAAGAWEVLGNRELMLAEARRLLYCYSGGDGGSGTAIGNLEVCLAIVKVALSSLRGGTARYVGDGGKRCVEWRRGHDVTIHTHHCVML